MIMSGTQNNNPKTNLYKKNIHESTNRQTNNNNNV